MMLRRAEGWGVSLLLSVVLACVTQGQQWSRFRGPHGQGISDAVTIPVKWTQQDYNWKIKLPAGGHGSPVIWNDRVFVTSEDPKSTGGILLVLNVSDGRVLWQKKFKLTAYKFHNDNSYATTTPVVDAESVYVLWQTSNETILAAFDHNGNDRWRRDFQGVYSQFGPGTSPMLYDDIVVFSFEHWQKSEQHQSAWFALDRKTGQTRWTLKRRSRQESYSTPCDYYPEGGRPQLIFTSEAHGIAAVNPSTGTIIWEVGEALPARVVSSPVIAGELLIGTCGKGGAGIQLAAVKAGSAERPEQAKLVYTCKGKSAPYVPTPLYKDGMLFTYHDQGDVSCLRPNTGEVIWHRKPGGKFYGSPVCVNGLLYCINRAGDVSVIRAAQEYELLAANPLGEKSQATPAISGGRMYLRTYSHLISIGGGKE
jgi:outer membrane protein assembly factor BamB